jgi:hypothetical protein
MTPVKIHSREGKEGFSLQAWALPVRNNPPLRPSSGGESHFHALWRRPSRRGWLLEVQSPATTNILTSRDDFNGL